MSEGKDLVVENRTWFVLGAVVATIVADYAAFTTATHYFGDVNGAFFLQAMAVLFPTMLGSGALGWILSYEAPEPPRAPRRKRAPVIGDDDEDNRLG
ncbi:MAG: hypothetical protein AAB955_01795 [Patescibacteria group bacterium]